MATWLPGDLVRWGARTATTAVMLPLSVPARVLDLLTAAESVVARADDLLQRTESVIANGDDLVRHTRSVVTRADELLDRTDTVVDKGEDMVGRTGAVVGRAGGLMGLAEAVLGSGEETVARGRLVIEAVEAQVRAVAPLLAFVEEFSAHELRAAIALVDELPRLAGHLTDDVLPLLATLDRVGPDLHELLDVVKDLRQAIVGIPGFGYLRRRGEDRD